MKKWLCFLLAALFLLTVGCGAAADDGDTATTTKGRLTKDDAIAAAEEFWGLHSGDRDPDTGYMLSVIVTDFPSDDDPYFRVVLRWMVEIDGEPDHPSQLDVVLVHADTGEVTVEGEQ